MLLTFLTFPSGVAILGESTWSQGDSKILEPGERQIVMMLVMIMQVFFSQSVTLYPSAYVCTENTLHTKCAIPCGNHKLSAGGAGRQVLPEGQVAVHGSGWGPGTEKQY